MREPSAAEKAAPDDLDLLARRTLVDLGLPASAIREDQARHYHELRRLIRDATSKSTPTRQADRQVIAAAGTLSKQAQHVLHELKVEAEQLRRGGEIPAIAAGSSSAGGAAPASTPTTPPVVDTSPVDEWGMPIEAKR